MTCQLKTRCITLLVSSILLIFLSTHTLSDEESYHTTAPLFITTEPTEIIEKSTKIASPISNKDFSFTIEVEINHHSIENSIKENSYVPLNLDDDYYVKYKKIEKGPRGVVSYIGDLYDIGFQENGGSIITTLGKNDLFSIIYTPDGAYELVKNRREKNAFLKKRNPSKDSGKGHLENIGHTNNSENSVSHKKLIYKNQLKSTGATVRVGVLYTSSVRTERGGTSSTNNWINTLIADYNDKLDDLGLSNYQLQLAGTLHIARQEGTMPSGLSQTEQDQWNCLVPPPTVYCDSIIADQRYLLTSPLVDMYMNNINADAIVLIVDDDLMQPNDWAHGFAGLKNNQSFNGFNFPHGHGFNCNMKSGQKCGQYAVVRDDYAMSNLTFHHEISHLFGLRDGESNSTPNDAAYTYGFYSNGTEETSISHRTMPMTIMGVSNNICSSSGINLMHGSCNRRLPFFADNLQSRQVYYYLFSSYYIYPSENNMSTNWDVDSELEKGMSAVASQN